MLKELTLLTLLTSLTSASDTVNVKVNVKANANANARAVSPLDPARLNNTVIIVSVGLRNNNNAVVFHPCDAACIKAAMWGDVARVFAASSRNRFGFAPPPASAIVQVALPVPMWSRCALADAWFHDARALVPNITRYTVRVFLYHPDAGGGECTVGGLSNHGCTATDCNSWLRGFGTNLVVHELGHLLGLSHAAWDANGDGLVNVTEATADASDPMTADGTVRTFAGPNRLWVGWETCSGNVPPSVPTPVLLTSLSLTSTSTSTSPAPAPTPTPSVWCRMLSAQDRLVVSGRTPKGVDASLGPFWAPALYMHRQNVANGEAVCVCVARMNETCAYGGVTATLVGVTADGTGLRVSFAKCQANGLKLTAVASPSSPMNVSVSVLNTDVRCPPRGPLSVQVVKGGQLDAACKDITITVTKDNSPAEISYAAVFVSSGVFLLPPTNFTASTSTQTTNLRTCGKDAVDVVFMDAHGDGYCCEWGPGSFSVFVNGVLLRSGGRFGLNDTVRVPGVPVWVLPGPIHPGRSATAFQVLRAAFSSITSMVLAVDSLP